MSTIDIWVDEADPIEENKLEKYQEVLKTPPVVMEWDFLGDGKTVFGMPYIIPKWKCFWLQFFFGSKFTKL